MKTAKHISTRTLGTVAWIFAGLPVLILLAAGCGFFGAAIGVYLIFSADLPRIPDLKAYKPKTVSTFYADDGSVMGTFYKEKRFPLPLEDIPQPVVNAFLAAEDARFYSHTGIDVFGIVRALLKNLKSGDYGQGGSTITQQVTKNFLLSKEKKISRKIREAILAYRLEKTLSKDKILELYINEIYFGRGSYGVEAAARSYFGKNTRDLTISEAAFLAGLVANPSRFSSPKNWDLALKRWDFVLNSLLRHGFIAEQEFKTAAMTDPKLLENIPNPSERLTHFTEAVRQYILTKYGEQRLYNEGLQVYTTCDLAQQSNAANALLKGARAWEKRQGRPIGLVKRLKPNEAKEFLATLPDKVLQAGDTVQAMVVANQTPTATPDKKKGKQQPPPAEPQECLLALQGNKQFKMQLPGNVRYKPCDLVEFKVTQANDTELSLEHNSLPGVQGAVVCIENKTGYVRALVGGLDFDQSSFNRATQAFRQPGSAFKPFVFAAALEWGRYSPNTTVLDEPIAVLLGSKEEWLPANSDGNFSGPITLRHALAHSRNIVAVKVAMDIGMDSATKFARNCGVTSPLRTHLSTALGASEVSPLELTSAYTVFPNLGIRVQPTLVKKVVDRFGKVLEDSAVKALEPYERMLADAPQFLPKVTDPPSQEEQQDESDTEEADNNPQEQLNEPSRPSVALDVQPGENLPRVLSPQADYLMLSMLREVCTSGTGAAANKLKRKDLFGKTGTTDDCSDAWFVGFNGDYTTGVWIGHDTKTSLGKHEHGATAALPIWMDFMKETLKDRPQTAYNPPPGIFFTNAPERPSPETLLESMPDYLRTPDIKPVASVDVGLSTGQPDPNSWFQSGVMLASAGNAETVRILSTSGQTLGYGYYGRDQKGKPILYPMTQTVPNAVDANPVGVWQQPTQPHGNPYLPQVGRQMVYPPAGRQ